MNNSAALKAFPTKPTDRNSKKQNREDHPISPDKDWMAKGTTLNRFVREEQQQQHEATAEVSELLLAIAVAGKLIAREVNKAGLAETMGLTGRTNVHGEEVQELDEFANSTMINSTHHTGLLAGIASEEMDEVYHVPKTPVPGKMLLVFDPVDGSSNIDVNVSIGTIFSVYRHNSNKPQTTHTDFLRSGREQLCAGYFIYGSSTMLVFTTGNGTHGFTLDPTLGEFLLSHVNIKIPQRGKIYSVNEGNSSFWLPGMVNYVNKLKYPKHGEPHSSRYIGSLVSDFHRNLLKGGIFLYPGDKKSSQGKLRALYEAFPLAFIVEQAGGRASTGTMDIIDIVPEHLHQRTPLIIGSLEDVTEAEKFLQST